MKRVLSALAFLLLAISGLADGKVFAHRTVLADATIPDQRALLYWSNGVERLVIETRFAGEGSNFAWVVPVPNPPVVEEASPGLFVTLAHQLKPELVHDPVPLFAVSLFSLAVGYLLLFVRRGEDLLLSDFAACIVAGASLCFVSVFVGVIALLLLLWVVSRIRQGREKPYAIALALLFAFLIGGMLLSTLSTAGGRPKVAGEVTELASVRVGAFDTTTLSAKTPSALLDWLRENQFKVSTNAEAAIADYIKRGWVFVTARLHRDETGLTTNTIHPLSFTFPSRQAVYPLRLTALGGDPLNVELYVFGKDRAVIKHFKVEKCAPLQFSKGNESGNRMHGHLFVSHPGLRQCVQGSTIVTKLTATLEPARMEEDAFVDWSSFATASSKVYSQRGALVTAANWSAGMLLAVGIVAAFRSASRDNGLPAWSGKFVGTVLGASLLVFGLGYAALPKVHVRLERRPGIFTKIQFQRFGRAVVAEWESSPPKSIQEARAVAARAATNAPENAVLGGQIREEDSPFNYVVRQSETNFQFIWFDDYGGEHNASDGR